MTNNTTETMQRLDRDFAALFGPSQPPSAPEECHDETKSYGPLSHE